MNLEIDIARLSGELETLAGFSDAPAPAVTRVVYSGQDRRAREYVKGLCAGAGLRLREDAVGNLFARWVGMQPELAPIATGSHIDAIPHAGRYDGSVGVLGGLEAIRALQRSGAQPRRSIELLIFSAEEPTRFGIGCFSSRMLAGCLKGRSVRDKDGKTLDEWRTAAGFGGSLDEVALPAGAYAAFVELHIEQGPLLEQAGIPLGIVTAIAAPACWRITIEGKGGHAGAMLMRDRQDAFCAAAAIGLSVELAARTSGSEDTVGTVGVCDVFPGAVNSVPMRVRLEVDVRDIDGARRDRVLDRIRQACDETSAARGVRVAIEEINADAPAQCDARVVDALAAAASAHELRFQKMVSRAYHDSLFMSRIAPTAMLFIPCRRGVSHHPDEYAAPEAIASGALVLAEAIWGLAGTTSQPPQS
jgi:N-carbamoyl-L-amino-acid hydrolase